MIKGNYPEDAWKLKGKFREGMGQVIVTFSGALGPWGFEYDGRQLTLGQHAYDDIINFKRMEPSKN